MSPIVKSILSPIIAIAILAIIYQYSVSEHRLRTELRNQTVQLTSGCKAKLEKYKLIAGSEYISPYVKKMTKRKVILTGYNSADIRAIQRGCNIIDDLQGQDTDDIAKRWYASRYVRGTHTSCDHCHQGIGDKQDKKGKRLKGSLSLAASWSNGGDAYDRFTGLLLPFELRQMQCFINSSNGFKPNISDDIIRDITAYSRFLSAALGLVIQTRYPEQGIDEIPASSTLKRGDDYVRGAALFTDKCAKCHGERGLGTVVNNRVIYPAVAGRNSFNKQSRNNFKFVSTILPGFICRNMPLGNENSLSNQQCRDIAFFISNLPRPAGDREGPLAALWQQIMMAVMPKLIDSVKQKKSIPKFKIKKPPEPPLPPEIPKRHNHLATGFIAQ